MDELSIQFQGYIVFFDMSVPHMPFLKI